MVFYPFLRLKCITFFTFLCMFYLRQSVASVANFLPIWKNLCKRLKVFENIYCQSDNIFANAWKFWKLLEKSLVSIWHYFLNTLKFWKLVEKNCCQSDSISANLLPSAWTYENFSENIMHFLWGYLLQSFQSLGVRKIPTGYICFDTFYKN